MGRDYLSTRKGAFTARGQMLLPVRAGSSLAGHVCMRVRCEYSRFLSFVTLKFTGFADGMCH
eukprot:5103321-Pyramimonas_sp.AAC.1